MPEDFDGGFLSEMVSDDVQLPRGCGAPAEGAAPADGLAPRDEALVKERIEGPGCL